LPASVKAYDGQVGPPSLPRDGHRRPAAQFDLRLAAAVLALRAAQEMRNAARQLRRTLTTAPDVTIACR
jgi:hypothetical protein